MFNIRDVVFLSYHSCSCSQTHADWSCTINILFQLGWPSFNLHFIPDLPFIILLFSSTTQDYEYNELNVCFSNTLYLNALLVSKAVTKHHHQFPWAHVCVHGPGNTCSPVVWPTTEPHRLIRHHRWRSCATRPQRQLPTHVSSARVRCLHSECSA